MTKTEILTLFVQVLVKAAADAGFAMRRIILIKYLYLLDVYIAQESGDKFSDFNWIFYKFGPFDNKANEFIDSLIEQKLILTEKYDSKYETDFTLIKPIENSPRTIDIWRALGNYKQSLSRIFKHDLLRFMDDTYSLLYYIYFETEPMKNVKMNQVLKFANLQKDLFGVRPYEEVGTISKTKINKIKEKLRKNRNQIVHKQIVFPKYDDSLLDEFDAEFFAGNEIEDFKCRADIK